MSHGRRGTVQKEAGQRALRDVRGFISAGDLHHRINAEGTPIGLATVYRQLNALTQSGHADTIPVPTGQLFRACQPGAHHHHLVCEHCGRAIETGPPDEAWIRDTAAQHGLTVTRHILEVFGRCADCPAA